MSIPTSQAFRVQSSSNVINIPTRYDGKGNQHVIRWKDIQLRFKDAQYVMNGDDTVLFLTNDDLEDLIPLRIAHRPGVILEVVVADNNQHDSRSTGALSIGHHHVPGNMVDESPSNEVVSISVDVAALEIGRSEDSQAVIVRPQHDPSEMAVQQVPISNASHFRLRTESNNNLQEQLYQLQQQMQQVHERMEEILGEIQQTNQQAQHTQQQVQQLQSTQHQMKDEIDTTRQTLQQLDRQTQGPVQKLSQHLEETQQLDESLQATQRVGEASQRRTQWSDYIW